MEVNRSTEIEALKAQVERLRAEVRVVRQLGFDGDRKYIFIGDKYGGLWYSLDAAKNPVKIESSVLTGYIRKAEFKSVGEGVKATQKLLIHVDADRQYVIWTGHQTHFAKGILSAIAAMTPEQLARPVRINPQLKSPTIYCNLHQDGRLIRAHYSDQTDWRAVSVTAYQNLHKASLL